MIVGWPTFKIICDIPIFYKHYKSNWKPGEWLHVASSLCYVNDMFISINSDCKLLYADEGTIMFSNRNP
jgi:hypothetical protein